MTTKLNHGDIVGIHYWDTYQGAQTATYAVHSAVSNAIAAGAHRQEG